MVVQVALVVVQVQEILGLAEQELLTKVMQVAQATLEITLVVAVAARVQLEQLLAVQPHQMAVLE
jgi:hypothetical protein